MKRTLIITLAVPAALLLASCSSESSETDAATPSATSSTTAPKATTITAARSSTSEVGPAANTPAVDEALLTLGETPGMQEFLPALVADGVATTSDELIAIGMYTPSMCQMKKQMNVSDADAAKFAPDDLADSGVKLTAGQATALIANANKHICPLQG